MFWCHGYLKLLGFYFVRNLYHKLITIVFPASNKSYAKSDQYILLVHRRRLFQKWQQNQGSSKKVHSTIYKITINRSGVGETWSRREYGWKRTLFIVHVQVRHSCLSNMKMLIESTSHPLLDSLVVRVLATSAGGPGINPQSRTASYQRRYKNGTR